MIRQLLKLLLLCLVSPCNSFAQFKNSNNPHDVHFKGKIDSATLTYYNIKTNGKELNDYSTYLYNAKGLLIEEHMSDDTVDSRCFKTVYSYDDKGNYTQVLDYNLSGKLKGKELYNYDPVKRLVKVRNVRNKTGAMLLDEKGNIIEDVNYHSNYPTPFSTIHYKYNSTGYCIESYQTWTGLTDMQKITYDYNGNGDLVTETVINDGSLLSSYTYSYAKFDKKHNWLIQNKYRDGHLINVAERIIAYRK